MSRGKTELVLVRDSGPVMSMSIGSWFFKFFTLVMILLLVGLGVGGYFLYRQHQSFLEMTNEVRLLSLRAERLESLAQEQENLALLSQQTSPQDEAAPPGGEEREAQAPPPAPEPAPGQTAEAAEAVKPAAAPPAEAGAQPAGETASMPASMPPSESDWVSVRNVVQRLSGNELTVRFEVANTGDPNEPAEGYVALVLRGKRQGKPWMESWPPMRLSPLGQPLNYRRGAPFSVMRFRRIRANFAVADKELEALEFLVYSREGELVMIKRESLAVGNNHSRGTRPTGGSGAG